MNEQQLAAVKQALEALEKLTDTEQTYEALDHGDKAITALQSIISQDALDWMAENARALGLDYEPAPAQGPCGWQFYQDGKWHNGMETHNHRANTEAAGVPVRDVFPAAQPAVPEGWKLIPMRATEEMIDVAATMLDDAGGWSGKLDMHEMWENLLAAAPEKGQP